MDVVDELSHEHLLVQFVHDLEQLAVVTVEGDFPAVALVVGHPGVESDAMGGDVPVQFVNHQILLAIRDAHAQGGSRLVETVLSLVAVALRAESLFDVCGNSVRVISTVERATKEGARKSPVDQREIVIMVEYF